MFLFRRIVSVLCLVLLTATLVAPTSNLNLVSVLPVVEMLSIAFVVIRIFSPAKAVSRNLDSVFGAPALRAPPQN